MAGQCQDRNLLVQQNKVIANGKCIPKNTVSKKKKKEVSNSLLLSTHARARARTHTHTHTHTKGVAFFEELAGVAFVERAGEEEDDIVDHVPVRDVVQELR